MEARIHQKDFDYHLADRELKTLDEHELVERLFMSISSWATIEEQRKVGLAVELMLHVHSEQQYGNDPYIRHPLRVAVRLADKFGVHDAEIINGGLLHDSVEDHADTLAALAPVDLQRETAQETCFALYAEIFSPRTSDLVRGVTNPPFRPGLTTEEFHDAYREAVTEEVRSDGGVGVIKMSDFFDNGVGLHHSPAIEFQMRQAPKYLPIADILRTEVLLGNFPIPQHKLSHVLYGLNIGEARLQRLVDA